MTRRAGVGRPPGYRQLLHAGAAAPAPRLPVDEAGLVLGNVGGGAGRACRQDAALLRCLLHDLYQRRPQPVDALPFQRVPRPGRVNAGDVEDLGAQNVAHTGDDRLVEQHRPDRGARCRQPPPHVLRVRVRTQWVTAQAGNESVAIARPDQLAPRRSDEVDDATGGGCPQPYLWPGRRGGRVVMQEQPLLPEVHVHDRAVSPVVEEVLAVGLDGFDLSAVKLPGLLGEAALGRTRIERPAQIGQVCAGVVMDKVTFGHVTSIPAPAGESPIYPRAARPAGLPPGTSMQTFLPYPSFRRSAVVLDDRRLGKQRVEVLQVLRALHLEGYGWSNHPAVLMWRGHTRALVAYGLAVVEEWSGRKYADATRADIAEFALPRPALAEEDLLPEELPPWLGWDELHRSHRAALIRKDPGTYAGTFPDTPSDLPYAWPAPPSDPPPAGPFSAWVVRAGSQDLLASFRAGAFVGVPASLGAPHATKKQRRQFHRFRDVVDRGDPVVVPAGGEVYRGVLAGPVAEGAVAGKPYVTRGVTWEAAVPRAALRRPYQLQDPQTVFALRGEPRVQH